MENILKELVKGKNLYNTGWLHKDAYIYMTKFGQLFFVIVDENGEIGNMSSVKMALEGATGEWVDYDEYKKRKSLKKDDPVRIRTNDGTCFNAHFSHFDGDGFICVFKDGKTSWTTDLVDVYDSWDIPNKKEDEE